MAKKTIETETSATKYSKRQLIEADKYKHNRDILEALLEEQNKYSHKEVENIIEGFLKGEVK